MKSFGDFADILADERRELWQSHLSHRGGATGMLLRQIIDQAAEKIVAREKRSGRKRTTR